jgi:hypothetical protein
MQLDTPLGRAARYPPLNIGDTESIHAQARMSPMRRRSVAS